MTGRGGGEGRGGVIPAGTVISVEEVIRRRRRGLLLSPGATPEAQDAEYVATLCRVYLTVLEGLYVADAGLRVLQCRARYRAYKAVVRRGRLQLLLHSERLAYLHSRRRDYVHTTWEMFRRTEQVAAAMQGLLYNKLVERYRIEGELARVPRLGWAEYTTEAGVGYWGREGSESVYAMPVYSLIQWRAASRLQRAYRGHLVYAAQRREQQRRLGLLPVYTPPTR